MERRDSILNIQEGVRGVLHGKDHEEHHKRTHDEGVHLQHAHKPVNNRTGKDADPRKKKHPKNLISPQSKKLSQVII